MNRRELLKRIALLTGGVMIGAEAILSGCARKGQTASFTDDDVNLLAEIADTILPATQTPGAKEAGVGTFMTVMVNDCYKEKDQKIFHEGLATLNEACKKQTGKEFLKADAAQRQSFLKTLDEEARDYAKKKKAEEPAHFFTMMKQLTLLGYFTSELGRTKALRYLPVPGRYDGCADYKKGDRIQTGLG